MYGRIGSCLLAISILILPSRCLRGQTDRPHTTLKFAPRNLPRRSPLPDPLRLPTPPRRWPIAPGPIGFPQIAQVAGTIFSGTVTTITRRPATHSQSIETVAVTFHVETAIRGSTPGEDLTISQWIGLWSSGQRYRVGERVLLFLYPPSKLGLTSCVAGSMGRFVVDPRERVMLSARHRRPDYRYHAHLLYADSASPSRLSANGGAITLRGTGFTPALTASLASRESGANHRGHVERDDSLRSRAHRWRAEHHAYRSCFRSFYNDERGPDLWRRPQRQPRPDWRRTQLFHARGHAGPIPVSVRVVAVDGTTPVSGATIGWSVNKNLQLSGCSGATSCSVTTDESGNAATWLTPTTAGTATITATLAPGVYTPAKSVYATLSATESASDIGVLSPYAWIAQGATVSLPVTARVVSNGAPQNVRVNFTIVKGTGSLNAASAQTDVNGDASVVLSVTQFAALV
jgi:hypothetical protein